MVSTHWHISMLICGLLGACSAEPPSVHPTNQATESKVAPTAESTTPREVGQEQSFAPRTLLIDLDETAPDCTEKGVDPGDTVSWTSSRIKDKQKVEVIFVAKEHPFKDTPKLADNEVIAIAPDLASPHVYSYTVREGTTVIGCGTIREPCGPPCAH